MLRVTVLALVSAALACSGGTKSRRPHLPKKIDRPSGGPPPSWVTHIEVKSDQLCGVGIAGAAFDKNSPYPKQMSQERAVKNLAGALETNIQEAIIDRETSASHRIDTARVLAVDEALIEHVAELVDTEYWLDEGGTGPFAQKSFTYAHSCLDATVAAAAFKIDVEKLRGRGKPEPISPRRVPRWIQRIGKQPGGRLCAVGFSLPTFHPDKTFDVVVEDVRSQLAEVLQTLVSSYYEELTTNRYQLFEMMTVASTEAVSKGAIITAFWYDRDGIGPYRRKRTTYGWGCVYPVDVMKSAIRSVEKELPEQTVAKVRERAQAAFDELDTEIEKRDGSSTPPPPTPMEGAAGQEPPPEPQPSEPDAAEPTPEEDAAGQEPAAEPTPEPRPSEPDAAEPASEFDPALLENVEYH